MACRVRIRLKKEDKNIETSAILNSGFETDSPDIIIPVEIAKKLGLWPFKEESAMLLETGGGEVSLPYFISAVELELILGDREPKKTIVNVLVNPYIHEVLISDYVSSILGIILLDFKRGLWRLSDDPINKIRESVEIEEW